MYKKYAQHINANEFVLKWVDTTLNNYLKENKPTTEEVEHILDYLAQEIKKISQMSYLEAKNNAEKWLKSQIKKGNDIVEKAEDTKIVLDFKDGFKIVQLIGENAYKREGFLMSHCVASYYGKDVEVYSLRDKDNMPHCTMEKNQQIKGKGNGDIHPKYISYIVKFLENIGMTVGDSEMSHLGYINIDKIKKYLHEDTKYFNKAYLPKDEKLIGKDGNEFISLDLLNIKSLISENDTSLKINFDLSLFIKLSIEFLSKTKNLFSSDTASSGNSSQLASSGYSSKLASSGYSSKLASSGNYSKLEISGKDSVGANIGINGKIKGTIGNWITLAEYDNNKPICVKSIQIDGKKIKENIWYKLEKGKFVEVIN